MVQVFGGMAVYGLTEANDALGTMSRPRPGRSAVELHVCSFSEAWITRTEDLPAGVVRLSSRT